MKKKYEVGFPSHCSNEQSEMMHDAVCWFLARFNMQWNGNRLDLNVQKVGITVNAKTYKQMGCYGLCYEWDRATMSIM